MTPLRTAVSFRSVAVRIAIFIVFASIIYVTWHERFGRFMFFEELDPPAADPHRTEHLRDAYYLIYGILGVILGLVASLRVGFRQAILTIAIGIAIFLSMRYRGIPLIFDQHSEEEFFGSRAFAIASIFIMAVIMAARATLLRPSKETTKAESDPGE